MRSRTVLLLCLGGGGALFGLGSCVYSSCSSDVDPPPKDGGVMNEKRILHGGNTGTTRMPEEIMSVLEPDGGHTIMDRGLISGGGDHFNPSGLQATSSTVALPPTDACAISPGAGCPHFVTTAEWATLTALPGAFVATPVPVSDGIDADADDGDDDDADADADADADGDGDHGVDDDDDDHGGDDLGRSNSAGAWLPAEYAAARPYAWPWRSLRLHENEATLLLQQGFVLTRYSKLSYHGQASAPSVPNPVCLMVYIVVVLVAAYRGNPRRGLRRLRRLQRRGRSSRYAKLQAARRRRRDGVALQMSFVSRFAFFRSYNVLDGFNHLQADADLFRGSRLNLHVPSDTYFVPVDTTMAKIPQEAKLLDTCQNVTTGTTLEITAAITPAPSTSEQKPAWNVKSLGTCTTAMQQKKKKQVETGSRAASNPSTVRVPVRVPARPVHEVRFSMATSPTDVLLHYSSCVASKANITTAAIAPAPSASGNKTASNVKSLGSCAEGANGKKKQEVASRSISTMSTVPSSIRIPAGPVHAVQLSGVKSSPPSTLCSVLEYTPCAAQASILDPTAAIPAAAPPSEESTGGKVESLGKLKQGVNDKKKLETSRKPVTVTSAIPSSVRIPVGAVQAVQLSAATSSAPSAMDLVLDSTCCTPQESIPKPAAAIHAVALSSKDRTTGTVEFLGTCNTRVNDNKKMETASKNITATFTTPSSVRIPARPVQAGQLPLATSSSPPAVHPVLESTVCAIQASILKPADSIPTAASRSKDGTAGNIELPGTRRTVANGKKNLETTGRIMTTAPSARVPAKPAQAVPLSTATSSVSSPIDLVLNGASCQAKKANIKPVAIAPSQSAGKTRSAGQVKVRGACRKDFREKLESALRSITAAPTSPNHGRIPGNPTSDDGSRHDAQAVPLAGAISPPPKMDVVLNYDSCAAKRGPTVAPMPLEKVEGLYTSRNPAILGIRRWFQGYVINIDPDGNCFGMSWLITAILWAVKNPNRLNALIAKLEHAGGPGNAFSILDERSKGYVDGLVEYLKTMQESWLGRRENDETCGVSLVVEVVKMFMGDKCTGYVGMDSKDGREPAWLKHKWGVAMASRSLDAWTAAEKNFDVDLDKLRTLGQSVILDFGPLQDTGMEGHTPAADVLRPGGSVGLLTGLVLDTYVPKTNSCNTHDFTTVLAGATKTPPDRTTTGLAVHKAGLPHFDVLLTPLPDGVDELFFAIFAATFNLPALDGEDTKALDTLRLSVESQQETPTEKLDEFVPEGQLQRQIAEMRAFE